MTANYGDPPHDELSESELDAVLSAADDEMLAYVRDATDPEETLLTIMAADDRDAASVGGGYYTAALIEMRSIARALTHHYENVFDRTRELVHALVTARDAAQGMASCLTKVTNYDLTFARSISDARDLMSGSADADKEASQILIRNLADVLDHGAARDIDSALAEDLERAMSELAGHDLASGASTLSVHDLDRILELARDLTTATNRVRRLDWISWWIAPVGARARRDARVYAEIIARDLERLLDRARWHLRSQAEIITRGLRPIYMLASIQVDASSADLSRCDFRDLDMLESVTWTPDTIWPSRIADRIRARSEEIRPGVHMAAQSRESDERREVERLVMRWSLRLGRSDESCQPRSSDSLSYCDSDAALATLAAWSRLSAIVKAGQRRAEEMTALLGTSDLPPGQEPVWKFSIGSTPEDPMAPARFLAGLVRRS